MADLASPAVLLIALAMCAASLGGWLLSARRFAAVAARLRALAVDQAQGPATGRRPNRTAEDDVAGVETLVETLKGRIANRHSVSGLPTREPLLAEIDSAGHGEAALGVIWFSDYDRLAAFDIGLAERMLVTLVARLARMVPADRFVAQVDRSHIAIWYPPGRDAAAGGAELAAVAYALGETIVDDGKDFDPGLKFASVSSGGSGGARELLARAIAALAGPVDGAASGAPGRCADGETAARDRYLIEQDLRRAVARGELELSFQPLVDAHRARVAGAEALIRWNHPERGQVPPARFIPIAEAAGLAPEIGEWTLNAACRAAADWRGRGLSGLRVAVNVSGHQVGNSDLPLRVARALDRHGVPGEMLEIELTETVATANPDEAAALLGRLRDAGVKIAIDDFGTGYSSLSTLRTLPFDKIKIDREFVTSVDTRRDSQAICASMIALADGLGIAVLAEGVERAAEYLWLRRHGCRLFQGFYFSRPLAASRFVTFARDTVRLESLCRPALLVSDALNQERLRA